MDGKKNEKEDKRNEDRRRRAVQSQKGMGTKAQGRRGRGNRCREMKHFQAKDEAKRGELAVERSGQHRRGMRGSIVVADKTSTQSSL